MTAQTLEQRELVGRAAGVGIRPADVVALTKPGITRMIVMTTALGLFMAPGAHGAGTWLLTLLGTLGIVSAANILNSWMERDVDALMERTRDRPLPAGRIAPEAALALGLVAAVLSLPILSLGVNRLTGLLALVAFVSYVAVYTPLKRIAPVSTLVGAVPGALPALMGWTAGTGRIGLPGLVLFGIVFFWQMPHFLAIGLFRREDYGRAGFRILPLVRSEAVTRRHMLAWTLPLVPVSLLLVPLGVSGWIYAVGALALGALFLAVVARGAVGSVDAAWPRRAFGHSLLYLSGIIVVMVLDSLLL